jgi:ribosomal protein S18 acetylase RimI-like enzyme
MTTPAGQPEVSLVFPSHYPEAAAMLGRAFADDPLMKAILPPGLTLDQRAGRAGLIFDVALRGQRSEGQPIFGVMHQGKVAAAAVIEQVTRVPSMMTVAVGALPTLPSLLRGAGPRGVIRAMSALNAIMRHRPPEPHLYLNILGVEPALQRRHFGVTLLERLRRETALRHDLIGVYLETATEANVAYYTHVGYEVIGEFHPIGVCMWRMLQRRSV